MEQSNIKEQYTVSKRMEIAAAHRLTLDYESKCTNLHGHNYIVVVEFKATKLNHNGMVVDFAHVKRQIHNVLDHAYLNDILSNNPTAENMGKWIAIECDKLCHNEAYCSKVSVQESEGNIATYEKDKKLA